LVTGVKSCLRTKFQEIRKYYSGWEYRDRNKESSCSFIYGHSPEICRKQGSRNHQEEYDWGKGDFVLTVRINEEVIRKYGQSQAKEETGQAHLEF